MPAKLGNKYTCHQCNAKYYDLNKDPAVCPKCDTVRVVFIKTPAKRSKRSVIVNNPENPVT